MIPKPSTAALARDVAAMPVAPRQESPLNEAEFLAAERLAGRVHAELHAVLRSLPPEARTASGLARLLGLERTVCQRMVAALQLAEPGPDLLSRLPGVRSLNAILTGCAGRGAEPERVRSAKAAVAVLTEFFDRVGGSQAVFARRLLMTPPTTKPETTEPETKTRSARVKPAAPPLAPNATQQEKTADALNDAARAIVGRWSRVQLQTAIYRPDPDRAGMMQAARIRGFLGHQSRPGALPLVMLNRRQSVLGQPDAGHAFEAVGGQDSAAEPSFAATKFCRGPASRLSSRRVPGGMVQILDTPDKADSHDAGTAGTDPTDPYDFVTADHSASSAPLPTVEEPALHEVWASIDYPAEHLLFDVWQHRDLARACIPALSNHLFRLNVLESIGEHWYTRLASSPRLALLGQGLEQAPTPLWDRHQEALAWMFDLLGWNPAEFVGYRCEVARPLWRTGYLLSFDFASGS